MSIRDNFRRRLETLNAAITKRDADRQGQAKNGLSTGAGHNPITGTPSVRQPDGGIVGTTTPITSGSLGQGNPVQVTGNGLRTVVDAAQAKAGEDLASASSIAGRGGNPGGGGSNSFIPPGGGTPAIPGYNPDTQDGGWVPGEDGTCSFKIWPKGKRPKTGVYDSGDECLAENAPGDWVCQDGQCVEAAEGQGRWRFKRECEEAKGPPPFEGGQCQTVYIVSFRWAFEGHDSSTGAFLFNFRSVDYSGSIIGPITAIEDASGGDVGSLTVRAEIADPLVFSIQFAPVSGLERRNTRAENIRLRRADGKNDNCGNPPVPCPS